MPTFRLKEQANALSTWKPVCSSSGTGLLTASCLPQLKGNHFVKCIYFETKFEYHPGWPGIHYVDKDGLELKGRSAPASQTLGLKAYFTKARQNFDGPRLLRAHRL